jgi:sirohydrochlorin cobaltochelatase
MGQGGDYRDAAVVLVAHGSTLNEGSGAPAYQHGDALRARRIFGEVIEAFVQQDPSLSGALRRVFSPRVFIVPLFMSDGWFSEHVVPVGLGLKHPDAAAFERVQARPGQKLFYCRSIGSHPRLTDVLLARAQAVVRAHPFPSARRPSDTALVIAGHGTAYSKGSRESITRQVERVRERGDYAETLGVFLEEPPYVRDTWNLVSAANIVLVPFFLSEGLHTREDIPVMLGESPERARSRLAAGKAPWRNPTERNSRRLWLAQPLGTEPLLTDLILEAVREAEAEDGRGATAGEGRESSATATAERQTSPR